MAERIRRHKQLLLRQLDVNQLTVWLLQEEIITRSEYMAVDYLMDFTAPTEVSHP